MAGKMPSGLRKYWADVHAGRRAAPKRKRTKGTPKVTERIVVTKTKRRSTHKASPHSKHKSRHKSGSVVASSVGHDFVSAAIPTVPEAVALGSAALYGKLEGDLAKDPKHFLASVPTPLTVVGRSGNLALGAWLLGALTRQPLVRAGALGLAAVSSYQMTRKAKDYTDSNPDFQLSGYSVGASPRYSVGSGGGPFAQRSARMVNDYLSSDDDSDE